MAGRAANPAIRLVCLPYLGAGAAVYRGWGHGLGPAVEVLPIEFPGHGARVREMPLRSVPALVGAIADALAPEFAEPYALFGYSLGGLVAFELARTLARAGSLPPVHLFVAATRPPHLPRWEPAVSDAPEAQVLEAMRRYEGLPEAVTADAELTTLLMPAIRADFRALETYRSVAPEPLDTPMTVFGGVSDPTLDPADLAAWRPWAGVGLRVVELPGGHFFLHRERERLLAEVARDLGVGSAR